MKTKSFGKFFGTFTVLAFALGAGIAIRSVSAGSGDNVFGFAWGGNEVADTNGAAVPNNGVLDGDESGLGWISFNDTDTKPFCDADSNNFIDVACGGNNTTTVWRNYGVSIPASGDLSGYAWSEHYGWISFNGADLAGCAPALSQATRTGSSITGGARILSIKTAMTTGNAGGFDGCISLSGVATDGSPYGVAVAGTNLSGYAWSSDLGWIDMSGASVGGATCGGQVTDARDGTVYDTVQIGTQCWMRENMNIGTRIPSSTAQSKNTPVEIIEKYCYNNQDANCTTPHPNYPDGGLYTWDEAMQYSTTEGAQGICPAGWHIPTDAEWYALENYLKDTGQSCGATRDNVYECSTAGTKLKPGGSSGFEGNLTGGLYAGSFFRDNSVIYWTSSQSGTGVWYRGLGALQNGVWRNGNINLTNGHPVRCLQGAGVVPPANILQLCRDGVPVAQGGGTYGFSLPTGTTTNIKAYYDSDVSSGHQCDAGSTDVTATATFTETNPTGGAISLSANGTNPKVFTGASAGTEAVTVTYSGTSVTMNATVTCVETANCTAEKAAVCTGSTVPSGTTKVGTCGTVDCSGQAGTRYCDFNWKEVAPGQ